MTLLIALVALNLLVNLTCGIVLITKFYFDTDEYNEPQPEGATSHIEHANQYEPREAHQHYREPEWEDRQRIGFRSNP